MINQKKKKKDFIVAENNAAVTEQVKLSDKLLTKIAFNIQMGLSSKVAHSLYTIIYELYSKRTGVDESKISEITSDIKIKFGLNLKNQISKFLTEKMLLNILEERNCYELCGYPFCSNEMDISKDYTTFIKNFDSNMFCCEECDINFTRIRSNAQFVNTLVFYDLNELNYLAHLSTLFIQNEYFKQVAAACYEAIPRFKEDEIMLAFIVKQLSAI